MITTSLKVMLWGKEIGRLSWDTKRAISYFEYNRDFLEGNLDPFPLIAPINSTSSRRPIIGNKDTKIYNKLPPFLADSLPDAWGNQVFECYRIENGIPHQDITPLDILSFIGKRAMGALEFIPDTSSIKKGEKLRLEALTELAQKIFLEREKVKILPTETLTMQSLIAVGISAGGRQPKAIIAINSKTGEIRSGQVAAQEGFEYCILKFGDSERSSAEIEMTYYEMALEAGIQMMPCSLLEVDGKKHFVTRRFDRCSDDFARLADGFDRSSDDCRNAGSVRSNAATSPNPSACHLDTKLHMQTLAALYPQADSYEQLLMVCRKMRLAESASEEVFRRMVFNILANNTDDHNKNFSFLMSQSGKWSLSPSYDLTYIFNSGGFLPETRHCLMMQGKLSAHTIEDAIKLAKENGIRRSEAIIRKVAKAILKFRSIAEKNGVRKKWISSIESCLIEHLEAWGLNQFQRSYTLVVEGITFTNVRIELSYKGNYHLYASINGKERKIVIRNTKEEYFLIENAGIHNITEQQLEEMLKKYFLKMA